MLSHVNIDQYCFQQEQERAKRMQLHHMKRDFFCSIIWAVLAELLHHLLRATINKRLRVESLRWTKSELKLIKFKQVEPKQSCIGIASKLITCTHLQSFIDSEFVVNTYLLTKLVKFSASNRWEKYKLSLQNKIFSQ